MPKAYGVFTVDMNGSAEMREVFDHKKDAEEYAESIAEYEQDTYHNEVVVKDGEMIGEFFSEF